MLCDIFGFVVGCFLCGDDVVMMLCMLVVLVWVDGCVVVFLELIVLYMNKDLYEVGDG